MLLELALKRRPEFREADGRLLEDIQNPLSVFDGERDDGVVVRDSTLKLAGELVVANSVGKQPHVLDPHSNTQSEMWLRMENEAAASIGSDYPNGIEAHAPPVSYRDPGVPGRSQAASDEVSPEVLIQECARSSPSSSSTWSSDALLRVGVGVEQRRCGAGCPAAISSSANQTMWCGAISTPAISML